MKWRVGDTDGGPCCLIRTAGCNVLYSEESSKTVVLLSLNPVRKSSADMVHIRFSC